MKNLLTTALAVFALSCSLFGLTKINPATQVNWPEVTGSGAPVMACSSINYGEPYTDTTANKSYVCTSSGWQASSGTGTTTNAMTAATTGGAAPGTTFNGSTPVTFDYHSFGAPGIHGTITPGNCTNWFSTTAIGDAGTPCGGGSSNAVQYNPSTAAYVFTGSSINEDDNRVTSSAIAVSSWSCNGTTCTVITSAAHGFAANDWVDVDAMTGWFASCGGGGCQDSGVGTFQVLSAGLTSTQFEFAYTTNTGSGTGGNVYSANYWGPYLASKMPYLNGHGTVYWRFAWASDCANPTTFAAKYGSITGSPKYFIFNGAQNDLNNGDTDTQVEGNLQACWQNAHNAGFIVIQASIVPTSIGSPPANYGTYNENVNQWLPSQAETFFNASSGEYFDKYLDLNSYAMSMANLATIQGNSASGGYYFAERVNEAFGTQGGSVNGPPPLMYYNLNTHNVDFYMGAGNGSWDGNWAFLDANRNQVLGISASANTPEVDIYGGTSANWKFIQSFEGGGTLQPWLDIPTSGINGLSGFGTGGAGQDTWMGWVSNSGYAFTNSNAGDIVTELKTTGKAWLIGAPGSVYSPATASFWENHFCVGARTCGTQFSTGTFGQTAANSTGGTCAMAAATTCTITITTTYTTPVCIATQQTAASPVAASCSVSGTTVTITAASSNSSTWGAFIFGNPN
jgi:hypothetical protein